MAETDDERAGARSLLMQRLFGSRVTEVLAAMARLDLADAIGDGIADVHDLARSCDLPADGLHRLLRALAGLGMCEESEPGKFALTASGALLRKDHPESVYDFARFHTAPETTRPWTNLEQALRTGRPTFDEHFGSPLYEYMAGHPELSARFAAAMRGESLATADTIAEHYDFSPYRTVTDVGGGDGTLITAILRRHPDLRGTIFETPEIAERAAERVRAAGLHDRCAVVSGDFFDLVPGGADLYLVKSTLHNWDDEHVVRILSSCRTALADRGRLLVIDVVLPDRAEPDPAELNPYVKDLQMLVLLGGRERTRAHLDRLCARAGLAIDRVLPLPPHVGLSLTEVVPAPAGPTP